jgi:ketosteroid isomerase-like protein
MQSRPVTVVSALVSAVTFALGCQPSTPQAAQAPVDHRAADQATILKQDSAWVKAIASHDTVTATSFYSTDAVLLLPGAPLAIGKPEIEKAWSSMMHAPGFALSFTPEKLTMGSDMAYELGSYQLSEKDKHGKAQTSNGKYVVVWQRQADSSWKAISDAATTTK